MHDAELAGRVEEELRAQGLTRTITDPEVRRQLAYLLGGEDTGARERLLTRARHELANIELRLRLDEDLL